MTRLDELKALVEVLDVSHDAHCDIWVGEPCDCSKWDLEDALPKLLAVAAAAKRIQRATQFYARGSGDCWSQLDEALRALEQPDDNRSEDNDG